ncbi:hypothetical protein I917_09270 [Mycobacterium tuberculosis str. Haarlem/NITR202]|uniref:L-threonylcarbamoyladenylate synthase n=1 Tax=Mycobacterium tuberculosis str. Haarlem/NITR202 TaxID=1304279 RepID=R4M4X1_MYCTX|nr:hypothetical protein I917_09270 [Mycobacterium tuberculosis str. Haarlem/NITR202]
MTETFDCADPEQRSRGIVSAVGAIKAGQLVVMPTDTVYGIGADAFDSSAVAALLSAKGRGRDMPVGVLVGSWHTIEGLRLLYARRCPRTDSRILARRAQPGGRASAVAAMGSWRCPWHRDAANAAATRSPSSCCVRWVRWRYPAPTSRATHPRSTPNRHALNSATTSRSISTRVHPNSRPAPRSSI